jgi:signal transduction histidine kinase
VPKPWDPRELRAAVRQALDGAQAARARARLGLETARAYARLQELDGLKTRFLTLAAHELRTPLHVLRAALEVLAGLGLGGEAPALVATAQRHAAWLGRSVGAMTDLVRLSHGGARRHVRLDLAAVVARVAADVRPFCVERRLSFVVDAAEPRAASGDADDLHRAVLNLCLNAIRFTADGGRVTLALRAAEDGDEIAVSDTGDGIPAALLPRLGEPFVTAAPLDAHHSDPIAFRSGGIGLGLAVVRAIVADHGGRFVVESEEGCGTIARIVLPRASAATVD